jgi:hypothetical protein
MLESISYALMRGKLNMLDGRSTISRNYASTVPNDCSAFLSQLYESDVFKPLKISVFTAHDTQFVSVLLLLCASGTYAGCPHAARMLRTAGSEVTMPANHPTVAPAAPTVRTLKVCFI